MRLFVALDIPDDVCTAILAIVTKLRPACQNARWVRIECLHVTLKFIGETSAEMTEMIKTALAGCGKSRKSCNEAAQNASNVHARNRSAAESRVQLHFPGAASAQGSSAAADPHDGGRNPEAAVAAVQQDVRESGSAVDTAGAVVARAAVADVVFGAQRAAADGRDGLQHFVPLVCGAEFG